MSTPPLSTSSSSTFSICSLSSFYSTKKSMLSVRLFSSRRRRHSHWGFYKMFSSSDPTLYTSTCPLSPPSSKIRRQSCCESFPSIKDLAHTYPITTPTSTSKPTTVNSIRAMELEALIESYPHYTLHLTLTPRICLET